MPKGRKKRKSNTGAPYNVSKKSSDSQQQDMDVLSCDKCKESVDQVIQCENCELEYCATCESIPTYVMDIITSHKQIHWFCHDCDTKMMYVPKNLSDSAQSTGSLNSKVLTDVISESLTKTVGQITAAIQDTIKKSLEEIADVTVPLRMDASQSDVQRSVLNPVQSSDRYGVVDAVDEYVEGEKRKHNLIFHNIPEPSDASSNEQRVLQDSKTVVSLVESEFGLKGIQIQRVARLGAPKQNASKSRLLLVEFGDISTKRSILKQAITLRKSSSWSNVFISPDLTPKERSLNKTLRDELKARRSAGEKDIYIRRGKIVCRDVNTGTSAPPPQ